SASAAVGAAVGAAAGAACARAGVATASDRASDSVEIMAFMGCVLWIVLAALSGAMPTAWRAAGAGSSREESRDRFAQFGLGHARHMRAGDRREPRVGQGRDQLFGRAIILILLAAYDEHRHRQRREHLGRRVGEAV